MNRPPIALFHGRYPMPGFKNFENATVTISGIELAQKIRKKPFDIAAEMDRAGKSAAQIWEVFLAA